MTIESLPGVEFDEAYTLKNLALVTKRHHISINLQLPLLLA